MILEDDPPHKYGVSTEAQMYTNSISSTYAYTIVVLKLDEDLIKTLRMSINETINTAIVKRHYSKQVDEDIPSWNQICALMDRIQTIVLYLDKIRFNADDEFLLVFDFYAFMTQASVLDDCVSTLAHIYGTNISVENSECVVFGEKGMNGKGSDHLYFEYLRSLCIMHPGMTSRYVGMYQNASECCPYMVFSNPLFTHHEGELIARVYSNDENYPDKNIDIRFNQIFEYVKRRYAILEKIVDSILNFNYEAEVKRSSEELLMPDDFPDYITYLNYLREQKNLRFPASEDYEIELIILMLSVKISDQENNDRYQKYCNALIYGIGFEHNRIQTMCRGNDIEIGIVESPRIIGLTKLDCLLHPRSKSDESGKYSYEFEKLEYLIRPYQQGYNPNDSEDAKFAASMILSNLDYFGRYVKLYKGMEYLEMYTLVHVNLYFDCLNNNCIINEFIPYEPKFRDNIE